MSDKKPIVLVDMDGVLADLDEMLFRRFQERHPELPLPKNLAAISPYVWPSYRKNFYAEDDFPLESRSAARAIVSEPGFFYALRPIDRAIQAMHDLAERADVFICTAPLLGNPSCESDKRRWVEKYLCRSWERRLIITKDKTLVRGDILIDDRPVIAGLLAPTWEHVIFDAPYNREVRDKRRLHWKWWSWQEILFDPTYESYKDHASPDFNPDRIDTEAFERALNNVPPYDGDAK